MRLLSLLLLFPIKAYLPTYLYRYAVYRRPNAGCIVGVSFVVNRSVDKSKKEEEEERANKDCQPLIREVYHIRYLIQLINNHAAGCVTSASTEIHYRTIFVLRHTHKRIRPRMSSVSNVTIQQGTRAKSAIN